MTFLDQYYVKNNSEQLTISAEQGSRFAKNVAGDFNPIHDPDYKRFCVPGDLLFSIALQQYGLNSKMAFKFLSLVSADTELTFPTAECDQSTTSLQVQCDKSKPVLGVEFSGECSQDQAKIEQVIKQYVTFSGRNFPHLLVPLMEKHNVMINPTRPLVIYENMSFEFDHFNFTDFELVLAETSLEVQGKRADAHLNYSLIGDGKVVGLGSKKLVLSGLREYQASAMQEMCDIYEASKKPS